MHLFDVFVSRIDIRYFFQVSASKDPEQNEIRKNQGNPLGFHCYILFGHSARESNPNQFNDLTQLQ